MLKFLRASGSAADGETGYESETQTRQNQFLGKLEDISASLSTWASRLRELSRGQTGGWISGFRQPVIVVPFI